MRMSISTTSGRCAVDGGQHAAAVVGLPDDLDLRGAREHHAAARSARAGRRRRAGRGSAHGRPRERRPQDEVARRARAVLSSPPASATRSREADQPAAGAGQRLGGDGDAHRPPADAPRTTSRSSATAIATSTAAAGACLRAFVRPSCTIAVGGPAERGRRRRVARARRSGSCTRIPAARLSSTSAGDVGERRLRRLGRAVSSPSRSTPMTSRSSSQRRVRAGPDHAGGLGDLLRRRVGPELERAGVQAAAARRGGRARRASRRRSVAARRRAPARCAAAARPRAARPARAATAPARAARARTGPSRTRPPSAARRRRRSARYESSRVVEQREDERRRPP